jgi:hypothetical protein
MKNLNKILLIAALFAFNLNIEASFSQTPRPSSTTVPRSSATATPSPSSTIIPRPSATAIPSPSATATPKPTATYTPIPTVASTPTPEPTPTPDCPKICNDAKQGYKGGYAKPAIGSCSFPNETQTSCAMSGEVNKCCCIACENNDRDCLCKNGTDEQVNCYANKQLGNCCTDIDLSNVTIVRDKINGSKCGANSCSTGPVGDFIDAISGETDIRLAICGSGCSNDICNTLRHEVNHSKECENGNNYTDGSCEGQDNHIINQNSVYSKCLQDFESKAFPPSCNFNCEWHKNSLKQYCCSFHKSVKNGKCLGGLSLDLCKVEFGLLDYACPK